MKNIYILAASLFLLMGFKAQAYGVYFVNGSTGNDLYDGSAPVFSLPNHGPKRTIQAAFNTATSNDDIYVANALYNETLTVKKSMTLHSSSNVRLTDLVMNGSGINLTLDGNLNLLTSLTLTEGYITTDSYSMVVADYTAAQYGGSKNSFVNGPFGVKVASSASHRMLRFPIGKDTNYRPAIFDATPASATASVFVGEMFNATPPELCMPDAEGIENVDQARYWCFYTSCTGILAAKITLFYGADDGVDSTKTTIVKTDDDTAGCWMNLCGKVYGDSAYGYIESCCRFFALGCFTLGNVDEPTIPLPVKMVKFDADLISPSVVQVKWTTASEVNNSYFDIERTTDFQNWVTVCRRPGHGTSNVMHEYSCNDSTVASVGQDLVYYRPKQVDFNGAYEYFNAVKIRLILNGESTNVQSVYPNPATDRINIVYNATENSPLQIRLLNTEGRVILTNNYIAKPGQQNVDLNLDDDNLARGVYILEVASDKQVSRHKIYKQ